MNNRRTFIKSGIVAGLVTAVTNLVPANNTGVVTYYDESGSLVIDGSNCDWIEYEEGKTAIVLKNFRATQKRL